MRALKPAAKDGGIVAADNRRSLFLSAAIATIICATTGLRPACAQTVTGGGQVIPTAPVSPGAPSWTISTQLDVGDSSDGTLTIDGGGTVSSNAVDPDGIGAIIGTSAGVHGTVTVQGAGSTWTNPLDLVVGYGGVGTLSINSGGKVTTDSATVGLDVGGEGHLTVDGVDSSFESGAAIIVGLFGFGGLGSSGHLQVLAGGKVSSASGTIGSAPYADGDALVTGSGSTWTVSGPLTVGNSGTGSLHIEAGGAVTSSQGYIGANDDNAGGRGDGAVTVTGPGSSWIVDPSTITIGHFGTGSLVIDDGGLVRVEAGVLVGDGLGSVGTLTVQSTTADPGVLETGSIVGGAGTANVTLDGGVLRATRDNPTFFDSFGTQTVTLGPNGGVIDTDGHDIGVAPRLVGLGGLTKTGAGTLILTGDNTYIGPTTISAGTLQLGGGGMAGGVGGDVIDNGVLAFNRSDVVTFAGLISGGGAVSQIGSGTTILTADNSYTGGTTVSSGTLQLGAGGPSGSIQGDVAVAVDSVLAFDRSGAMTLAGLISGGGAVRQIGSGTTILTADNSYTGGTTVSSGMLQLGAGGTSGSIQGDVAVDGALAFDRSDAVTFAGVISGGGQVQQIGSGVTVLTANSSAFMGRTEVRAGTLEVDGALGGSADVLSGGRLSGLGQVGPTTNRGVIAPGRGGFGTLTIAGDYSGLGGGLEIKTQLGGDASPTDRLVVAGSTSGSTPVKVTNLGGLGAQTQKGVQVVQVHGASAGQFTLANGAYAIGGQPAVVAGAYGYVLQKDQADGGWYLRSALLDVAGPDQGGDVPDQGGAPAPDGGSAPLYQPGMPVYEAYANTILSLSEASTLRQRVGDRRYDVADPDRNGVWARVEGKTSHLEPTVSTSGIHQDIDSWKAQFGVDRVLSGAEDGAHLVGGLTAQLGTADTRLSSVYGGGDIDTKAYGVGATLTWYGQHGAYLDAQAQATWFDSDLSSKLAGRLADNQDGHGYGLSVETGKAFPVGGSALSVTPQAQLSYASTGFGDFSDRFEAQVGGDRGESLQGRLGLALDHRRSWQDAAGHTRQLSLYGLIDARYEALDGVRVLVSGTPIDSRQGRGWGGLGAGGNYSWGDGRYSLYGEAVADTDLASFGDSYTVTATAGFRIRF